MIKRNFKCNNCEQKFSLFLERFIPHALKCTSCKSDNIKQIFTPVNINKDSEELNKGELSQKYIEENSMILDNMKKEKMEWN